MSPDPALLIGLVSISDRASSGVYEDKGAGLVEWFTAALASPWRMEQRLIPDDQPGIERTLISRRHSGCHLVLTTGGTALRRATTPEATLAVAWVLPGFGEQVRQVSLKYVPTAILSRQLGVVRGSADPESPGPPKAIKETTACFPRFRIASISSAALTSKRTKRSARHSAPRVACGPPGNPASRDRPVPPAHGPLAASAERPAPLRRRRLRRRIRGGLRRWRSSRASRSRRVWTP
jgi:molybdopterin adenylyltransferase